MDFRIESHLNGRYWTIKDIFTDGIDSRYAKEVFYLHFRASLFAKKETIFCSYVAFDCLNIVPDSQVSR